METNYLKHENIFIIAGGPSAKNFDLSRLDGLGYKLGINDAILYTACQGGASMDRTWIKNRQNVLKQSTLECYFSKKHFSKEFGDPGADWPNVKLFPVDINQNGMSKKPDVLQAKNSGFMGANLVYHWHPKNLFLFGFDLTLASDGQEHWYKDYPWRPKKHVNGLYATWIDDHNHAAKQFQNARINVYNVSAVSKLQCYPKIGFNDVFKYISQHH